VGVNDDEKSILPSCSQDIDSAIYLIGETNHEFGASLYMKELYNKVEGTLADIDLAKELKLWDFIIEANKKGLLSAAKDVNVGGIAIALAKMAVVGDKGIACGIKLEDERDIFSESFSRALVEVKDSDAFESYAKEQGIMIDRIGKVNSDRKFICNDIKKDLDEMQKVYFNTFEEVVEQDI